MALENTDQLLVNRPSEGQVYKADVSDLVDAVSDSVGENLTLGQLANVIDTVDTLTQYSPADYKHLSFRPAFGPAGEVTYAVSEYPEATNTHYGAVKINPDIFDIDNRVVGVKTLSTGGSSNGAAFVDLSQIPMGMDLQGYVDLTVNRADHTNMPPPYMYPETLKGKVYIHKKSSTNVSLNVASDWVGLAGGTEVRDGAIVSYQSDINDIANSKGPRWIITGYLDETTHEGYVQIKGDTMSGDLRLIDYDHANRILNGTDENIGLNLNNDGTIVSNTYTDDILVDADNIIFSHNVKVGSNYTTNPKIQFTNAGGAKFAIDDSQNHFFQIDNDALVTQRVKFPGADPRIAYQLINDEYDDPTNGDADLGRTLIKFTTDGDATFAYRDVKNQVVITQDDTLGPRLNIYNDQREFGNAESGSNNYSARFGTETGVDIYSNGALTVGDDTAGDTSEYVNIDTVRTTAAGALVNIKDGKAFGGYAYNEDGKSLELKAYNGTNTLETFNLFRTGRVETSNMVGFGQYNTADLTGNVTPLTDDRAPQSATHTFIKASADEIYQGTKETGDIVQVLQARSGTIALMEDVLLSSALVLVEARDFTDDSIGVQPIKFRPGATAPVVGDVLLNQEGALASPQEIDPAYLQNNLIANPDDLYEYDGNTGKVVRGDKLVVTATGVDTNNNNAVIVTEYTYIPNPSEVDLTIEHKPTEAEVSNTAGTGFKIKEAKSDPDGYAGLMIPGDKQKLEALPADGFIAGDGIDITLDSTTDTSKTSSNISVDHDSTLQFVGTGAVNTKKLSAKQQALSSEHLDSTTSVYTVKLNDYVTNAAGTSVDIPIVTTTKSGLMSGKDKATIDELPDGGFAAGGGITFTDAGTPLVTTISTTVDGQTIKLSNNTTGASLVVPQQEISGAYSLSDKKISPWKTTLTTNVNGGTASTSEVPVATTSVAGLLVSADFDKLQKLPTPPTTNGGYNDLYVLVAGDTMTGNLNMKSGNTTTTIIGVNGSLSAASTKFTVAATTGDTSIAGITSVTNGTEATSTTVASLKTAGGLGVAKKAFIGGITSITDTTDATTTSTGSLKTAGGLGVALQAFIGGVTTVTNSTKATATNVAALKTSGGLGVANMAYIGGKEKVTHNAAGPDKEVYNVSLHVDQKVVARGYALEHLPKFEDL